MNNKYFLVLFFALLPINDVLAEDKPVQHSWISFDANLELKKAGSHGMLGTRTALAIQPLESHRIKLHRAYFSNDRGAASDTSDGSSFGLGDFFACLFGSCPDEDYSSTTTTGGNTFYEYEESAILYQYRLSQQKTGANSYGEVWIGAGGSSTERTTKRYQLNNGDNTDVLAVTKDKGIAWEIDFVNRHKVWFWEASLLGSTSSESFGASLGLGLGF